MDFSQAQGMHIPAEGTSSRSRITLLFFHTSAYIPANLMRPTKFLSVCPNTGSRFPSPDFAVRVLLIRILSRRENLESWHICEDARPLWGMVSLGTVGERDNNHYLHRICGSSSIHHDMTWLGVPLLCIHCSLCSPTKPGIFRQKDGHIRI